MTAISKGYIAKIAEVQFPNLQQINLENGQIKLMLDDQRSLIFDKAIEDIVKQAPINGPLTKKLGIVFKKYDLKIIDMENLNRKIIKIAEQSHLPPKPKKNSNEKPEDILLKADVLLSASVEANTNAKDQDVVLFIGNTGAGKSTTINYLLGHKIKKVPRKVLGIIGTTKDLLVAEGGVAKIGHQPGSSKTSFPIVIQDPVNRLAYCDCPGFSDTRGPGTEIFNAFSIREVTDHAKSVKGFVVFIEHSSFEHERGTILKNIKFLQLLIKDFKKHERAIMFLVTKAPHDVDLAGVKETLLEFINDAAENSEDLALKTFCEQMCDSGIFQDRLGNRVMLCNPAGETQQQDRKQMLEAIKGFAYDKTTVREKLGYPLSERVKLHFEITRQSIHLQTAKLLKSFQERLKLYWVDQVKDCTPEITLGHLKEIDRWLLQWKPLTCEHLIQEQTYSPVSTSTLKELEQSVVYWNKMNEISESHSQLNEKVDENLGYLVKELENIRENVEKLYHQRMHDFIINALKNSLESFNVQSQLDKLQTHIDLKKLKNATEDELSILTKDLAVKISANIKYTDHLNEILLDTSKSLELKNLIQLHVFEPFQVLVQDKRITVKALSNKIAMSEVIKKAKPHLNSTNEVMIHVDAEGRGVLYFDTAIQEGFKNKIVVILADLIEVMGTHKIDLAGNSWRAGGALTLKGRLKGKGEITNKCYQLSQDISVSETTLARCQWPL